ncbi:MAG TPA: carboxymuconolactone decarboxylase family protein [Thermoanaerobaculia bacterium]
MSSEFPVHTTETAPAGSRRFLEGLQKEIGFLPNLAATMGESPTLIEAFTSLRSMLGRSAFTPIERETISLAVSVANDCSYCIAAHSTFARRHGASEDLIDALRAGELPGDGRLGALARYTRELLRDRGHVSDTAKQAMLDAGYTRAQLLETIAVVAFTTIANYAHNVTKCPIDAPFTRSAARVV